jgi:hypothetical protein
VSGNEERRLYVVLLEHREQSTHSDRAGEKTAGDVGCRVLSAV